MTENADIARLKQVTEVRALTSPNHDERILFFSNYMEGKHGTCVARQIPIKGYWKYAEGLTNEGPVTESGMLCVDSEQEQKLVAEYISKGYVESFSNMYDIEHKVSK